MRCGQPARNSKGTRNALALPRMRASSASSGGNCPRAAHLLPLPMLKSLGRGDSWAGRRPGSVHPQVELADQLAVALVILAQERIQLLRRARIGCQRRLEQERLQVRLAGD